MKSKIIIIAILAIFFGLASCGSRSAQNNSHDHENGTEHNHNTHTHADGTVHSDHAPEQDAPHQESFKVEADTLQHNQAHDHNH